MIPLAKYANWVANEVLSLSPYERIQNDWIPNWSRTLKAIQMAKGLFEIFSIICTRWEFLGSFYQGTTDNTNYKDAVEYVSHFLYPLNQDYQNIHDMSSRGNRGSEFFTMFRNKSIHGYTPAAVALQNNTEVIGWWIGSNSQTQKYHLQIHNGLMHVDSNKFISEFLASLHGYSTYFMQDQDIVGGRRPSDRWHRGFWARFKPLHIEGDWMQEGYRRGIPP